MSELLAAAKVALEEMCNTVAPRNSFTDAVVLCDYCAVSGGSR